MMEDEAVFSVLAQCFGPVDESSWNQLAGSSLWSDFLDGARRAMQDAELGVQAAPAARARKRCPLQEFLSSGEVNALFAPPTYEEKQAFAARHFTGGLPESAVPVESLYRTWSAGAAPAPFSQQQGLYLGDSAHYLRELVERLGMEVPPAFAACPDHLALELDLVAVMLRSGMREEARQFLAERFAWLTAYRMRLLALEDDARFYIGLVDVILAIRAPQTTADAVVA